MSPLNTSSGTAAVPLFLLSVSAYAFAPLRVLNGYFLSFFGLFLHLTAVGILPAESFFPLIVLPSEETTTILLFASFFYSVGFCFKSSINLRIRQVVKVFS